MIPPPIPEPIIWVIIIGLYIYSIVSIVVLVTRPTHDQMRTYYGLD